MRIAVLGGGNGALAAAAHLTYAGHEVTLYNRTYQKLSCFVEEPTLKIGGGALPVSNWNVCQRIWRLPLRGRSLLSCASQLWGRHIMRKRWPRSYSRSRQFF